MTTELDLILQAKNLISEDVEDLPMEDTSRHRTWIEQADEYLHTRNLPSVPPHKHIHREDSTVCEICGS